MKKSIVIIALMLCISLALAACGNASVSEVPSSSSENVTENTPLAQINAGFLKGPTGMGGAQLAEKAKNGKTLAPVKVQVASEPTAFTAALINGELDIAALPVNAAATLYAKTGGKVQILAVNTLGVMYILNSDNSVHGIADLKGKKLLSAGQGASPEYVLNRLLEENGLEVGKDVTVEYATEHAEVMAQALAGKYDTVLLPEPFVTKIQQKNADFKIALDLTVEWAKLGKGELLTSCVAVRRQFAEENPQSVKAFLSDYEASVKYTAENPEDAARLMEANDIIDAQTAKLAMKNCNITFMAGAEMQNNVSAYLQVLADADIASVGGKLPDEEFYASVSDK